MELLLFHIQLNCSIEKRHAVLGKRKTNKMGIIFPKCMLTQRRRAHFKSTQLERRMLLSYQNCQYLIWTGTRNWAASWRCELTSFIKSNLVHENIQVARELFYAFWSFELARPIVLVKFESIILNESSGTVWVGKIDNCKICSYVFTMVCFRLASCFIKFTSFFFFIIP